MTREEKIRLLQQIAEGQGSIEDLMPAIEFQVFRQVSANIEVTITAWNESPPIHLKLNDAEYQHWLKGFDEVNSRRKSPHTIKCIEIIADENCKILYHCKGIDNCLNGCGCEHDENAMRGKK
jgi:hypothetical protein